MRDQYQCIEETLPIPCCVTAKSRSMCNIDFYIYFLTEIYSMVTLIQVVQALSFKFIRFHIWSTLHEKCVCTVFVPKLKSIGEFPGTNKQVNENCTRHFPLWVVSFMGTFSCGLNCEYSSTEKTKSNTSSSILSNSQVFLSNSCQVLFPSEYIHLFSESKSFLLLIGCI